MHLLGEARGVGFAAHRSAQLHRTGIAETVQLARSVDQRLSEVDRRSLLELADAASRTLDTPERLLLLVDGLTTAISGEVGGFNYVDATHDRAVVLMRPQVVDDPIGDLQREDRRHPVVRHYQQTNSLEPLLITDCSMGRWRRWSDHPTYAALFRPMGTPFE